MKIAVPMLSLGLLLSAISLFAAWEIHRQQSRNSDMVAREVYGLQAVGELHITMREIRYQLNLFLRTHGQQHLRKALALDGDARMQLRVASTLVRNDREHRLIETVDEGYNRFHSVLSQIAMPLVHSETAGSATSAAEISEVGIRALSDLADEQLTQDVLTPLFDSMVVNREILERMDEAGRTTAQRLTNGLLICGICGAAAGVLLGVAVFRAVAQRVHENETELLRREQLAQVGQLAAGMAHELRNPLMPMKMLVQAAIEHRESGLVGRSLDVVSEEICRLEKAIEGFLEFARPALPQKAPVDIRDLVTPTLDLVSGRAARQGIVLVTRFPQRPATVCVDRGQIRQLLLNFLLNSMDAMPEGGKVEVQVEERPAGTRRNPDEHAIASDPAEPEPGYAIRVTDTGSGVLHHVLPNVFEPFVTTKETGTGLGLSLCSRIAAAHGGRITARNLSPRGAEFALELPFDRPD